MKPDWKNAPSTLLERLTPTTTKGASGMTVKGNHPLAEIIAKKLSSIESVPREEQRKMVNRACKAAVEYHEKDTLRLRIKCNQYAKRLVLLGDDDVVWEAEPKEQENIIINGSIISGDGKYVADIWERPKEQEHE